MVVGFAPLRCREVAPKPFPMLSRLIETRGTIWCSLLLRTSDSNENLTDEALNLLTHEEDEPLQQDIPIHPRCLRGVSILSERGDSCRHRKV